MMGSGLASIHPKAAYFPTLHRTLRAVVGADALRKARTLLEFGCGMTGFIELYRQAGQTAYALDIHDYAKAYSSDVRFLVSDGETIPLESDLIDLVVSHSVIEHIDNLHQSLSEITRVTKVGGLIYITVSPLYYAPTGSHNRALPNWGHLDPSSPYYMLRNPLEGGNREGAYLNQRRLPEYAELFAMQPWDIMHLGRRFVKEPMPDFLGNSPISKLDLRTREFRLVARKLAFPE